MATVIPLRQRAGLCAGILIALALGACASNPPARRSVSIMGRTDVPAAMMVAWFHNRSRFGYRATESVEALAAYFVEEAAAEDVRGDLAFVQAVLETNWFAFTGVVDPSDNNFAGIGATDDAGRPHRFPDARTGIRAQIQHLRAYADRTATACRVPPLHRECSDPRFEFVTPKGRATTWQQMGGGNWATDQRYAAKILALYYDLRRYAGLPI